MKLLPISPTDLPLLNRFVSLLQQCMKTKALRPCKQIHSKLLYSGVDMKHFSLNSKLVGAYAMSGDLSSAELILKETESPNVFAFNCMISATAFLGQYKQAIGYFSLMQKSRVSPNSYTFSFVLKACVGLTSLGKGKEVHAAMTKSGFESHVSVGNALIDMYCKCESLSYARIVFDKMTMRDVASWTSMICGYCSMGMIEESLVLFERMGEEGCEPNDFTWNAMVAGYARRGDCDGAIGVLSRMNREGLVPDLVTWNAMISGFVQNGQPVKALEVFGEMLVEGIRPNHVTVTGLLPACGMVGSVERGNEIHGLIYRRGLFINVFVASALIDMYGKCGCIENAWNVFDKIPIKNVASWNAMIGCYGKHSMVDSAMKLFEKMQEEGMQCNQVTMTCVLSACSHGGFVEKGLEIFRSMRESYGVEVSTEHYACIVDLLCRSGRMEEAYKLVQEMPFGVTDSVVGAFFNGCKIYKRSDLAKLMAMDICRMELKRPGGYVTLSNIYAADGEWEEVENVRKVMKEIGVHKKPGSSWIEKNAKFPKLTKGEIYS